MTAPTSSRLILFLAAQRKAESARASLPEDRFDVAELEDGDIEVNGMVFRLSEEAPPALHAWHFESAKWGPGERAAAESSLFALRMETELEEPPLRAFKEQLAVARAIGGADLTALFDESAERLIPPSKLDRLLAGEPGPRELFAIHSVGPGQGDTYWVHTHGLARARVPELDLLGVPAEGREAAGELLDAAAALFLSHGVPPRAAMFPVGEGVDLVLLPLDEALARAPAKGSGGAESRDGEHREAERVVLAPADARTGGSPVVTALLPRVSRAVLFRSPEDTERMRALARERWDDFERLFRAHATEKGWVFLVKLGYEPDRTRDRADAVAREHLWFRVKAIEPGRVEALLESTPTDIASLRKGEARWHELARLTDWLVVTPGGEIAPR